MKQPETRSDFISEGDECNYLSDMITFYASTSPDDSLAVAAFTNRLGELLAKKGFDDGSIMLQSHWALYHESLGAFTMAVAHREREVELIERLFENGGPIGDLNYEFLAEVLRTLSNDYLRVGEASKATEALARSQSFPVNHGHGRRSHSRRVPPKSDRHKRRRGL